MYELYKDPGKNKLVMSQAKLGREIIKLDKKVRKIEKEIKVISIRDIIPEDFDGEIAEKQAKDIPKIFKEMDKNINQALNLAEGIQSQIRKIDYYKSNLQVQIGQLKRQIDLKDSEIRSISRKLLNM